jgi:hypothetical protein
MFTLGSGGFASTRERPRDPKLIPGDIAEREARRQARRREVKQRIEDATERSKQAQALQLQLQQLDLAAAAAQAAIEEISGRLGVTADVAPLLAEREQKQREIEQIGAQYRAVHTVYLATCKDSCPAVHESDLFKLGRPDLVADLAIAQSAVESVMRRIESLKDNADRFTPSQYKQRADALERELSRARAAADEAGRAVVNE